MHRIKLEWDFNQKEMMWFQENVFEEVVCKTTAILYRLACVKQIINVVPVVFLPLFLGV